VTENVLVPIGAVSAIYARETGAGMGFEVQPYEPPVREEGEAVADEPPAPEGAAPAEGDEGGEAKRPHLTIVK